MDHHVVLTHAPFCLFAVGTAPSGDRREVHVERWESLVEHQIWRVSANMGIFGIHNYSEIVENDGKLMEIKR